ncbi:hypothetical protein KUF57_26300 [Mycolicibacterium sp. PAM1]|uniref:hypothetical protein n=1 Tax=Mycolicibacterium sp. PAM1 TaxID=2853535 RepID=UPI001C3C5BA7|nr:hypothetical protein [Mycolicibacterium sp. PAM1]MBV5247042.1 hypothetical protein [Mycolicibacterium sp. PAM1]
MKRVLDPRSTRSRVNPLDIHRRSNSEDQDGSGATTPDSEDSTTTALRTEVEVTLFELGPELEDLLDDYLEAFDASTGELADGSNAAESVLGMRMCYRATYDFDSDTGDHWVDSPARSDVDAEAFRKVPRADREVLPVLFLNDGPPLQIRAEGAFRALLGNSQAETLDEALASLDDGVRNATEAFSSSTALSAGIQQVLDAGAADLLGVESADALSFVPDDGTLATLLRVLQPAAILDDAGPLPLRSHGTTVQSMLAVAEGIAAAKTRSGDLVIVADDFGDQLDASAAEHLAGLVRKAANQLILTTRRPEVVRSFDPESLLRFTRSHGTRSQHQLAKADKHDRVNRRLILDQLLAALTGRTVVLVEGPLDLEGYGALASRLTSKKYSLPANGLRLVCPPGADGGITRLLGLANLATQLGFHVKAIVDSDKPGSSEDLIDALLAVCEQVVVLPTRTAVEAALIRGVPGAKLRKSVQILEGEGYMDPLPDDIEDDDIASYLVRGKVLKKQGLHIAWVRALTVAPPIGKSVIEAVCSATTGRVDIADAT